MDRHSWELEEMDVEGILAFAERVLPSASTSGSSPRSLRSSACSRCSFRRGFASTEKACWNRRNAPVFNYLQPVSELEIKDLVDLTGIEPVTS